jgi:hypothetical protein
MPPQQIRRMLAALHTNRSVKELNIFNLMYNDGASWVADLLRHKTDFTDFHLTSCSFQLFTQILPLLRGQRNLPTVRFSGCRSGNGGVNDILLFDDPEYTQLFVNNVLLSPFTSIKTLFLNYCGASVHNRQLMEDIRKNTTIVKLLTIDERTDRSIAPILQRNVFLNHANGMLMGTTTSTSTTTEQTPPTHPPPCGLWPAVIAKVGRQDD